MKIRIPERDADAIRMFDKEANKQREEAEKYMHESIAKGFSSSGNDAEEKYQEYKKKANLAAAKLDKVIRKYTT